MELLYFWIGCAITFLIIEMVTATFYGLSLAIASGLVACYVWFLGPTGLDILQGVIFAGATFISSFTLPRLLVPGDGKSIPQGMDAYIGQKRKVKLQGESLKITLDGVDYPIENEEDVKAGDYVEIISSHSIAFFVKKVQK